jgi:hypothetical protein
MPMIPANGYDLRPPLLRRRLLRYRLFSLRGWFWITCLMLFTVIVWFILR